MAKILPFKNKEQDREREIAEKLLVVANEIDNVLLHHLQDQDIDIKDLVGILSHRLGSLMSHIDEKSALWDICEKVLKRQAKIEL